MQAQQAADGSARGREHRCRSGMRRSRICAQELTVAQALAAEQTDEYTVHGTAAGGRSGARSLLAPRADAADGARAELTAALAAKRAAETEAEQALTEAETRAALLSTAREQLSAEKKNGRASAEADGTAEPAGRGAARAAWSRCRALLDEARDSERRRRCSCRIPGVGTEHGAGAGGRGRAQARGSSKRPSASGSRQQTQDLERYRSEFFGRLRDVLGRRRVCGSRATASSFPPKCCSSRDRRPCRRRQG